MYKAPLHIFVSIIKAKLNKYCVIIKQEWLYLRTEVIDKPIGNLIDQIYKQKAAKFYGYL